MLFISIVVASAYGGFVAEFIQTEEFGGPGEQGERYVWEAVKAAFTGREALAFWRYPSSKTLCVNPIF